jgi:single-strand DNA-binding protein
MANKVILVGNVGRDPEIKSLPSGTRIATFSLATNERRRDQDGNWGEHTEWHNLVVWDRLVDVVERFVTRGKQLYIEGKIRTRTYETDGQKKYFTEIHVRELELLGSAGGGGGSGARQPDERYGSSDGGGFPDDADDVPF